MKTKRYIPMFFDVCGAPVLVVGAGPVALRKIETLLAREARVTVVAKAFAPQVEALAREGILRAIRASFRASHAEGMALVFAATENPSVNRAAARAARRRGIPVNVADAPDDCSFIVPAVAQGDGFTLAVSTEGRNPGAARAIREFLEEHRAELSVRMERGRRRRESGPVPGKVHIVGAGPGDPDLLTVRALGLLRAADAVIHDYLVPEGILSLASPRAVRLCFARKGDTAGHGAAAKQEAIHDAMVRMAREGLSVVRLKSGDPYLFGRGGEEAEALARAGVPFEIVPGISAAFGCAAAAGIPLTQRGLSSSLTLLAGHEADRKQSGSLPPRLPLDGTVAIYMGVGRVRALAEELASAGFPGDTPFAVVENGTRPEQRVLRGLLRDLPRIAVEEKLRSPAVLFVGKCAAAGTVSISSRPGAARGRFRAS